jgi:hypothetical protein
MPSALSHDPAITVPGASTDNAVVIFDGTGGTGFGNSTILVDSGGNGRIGIATDTNIITLTNETVAVAGAITGVTALTVDNININGNTISSTAGTDLLITPLAGQQLILDGTIIIDAGVVTAATSITSTEFVGGGVGITALVAGNITAGGTFLAQDGSALTALNGTQVTTGTVAAARLDLSAKANLASPVFTTSIRITPQSSAPGSPATGTIYYDTEDNIAYVYNGTDWMALNLGPLFAATGGNVDDEYTSGGVDYKFHVFTSNGNFVVTGQTGTIEYLVIGGGGGGGHYAGGGAGGYRTATGLSVAAGTHAVVVGDGGAGNSGSSGSSAKGSDGVTSSIGSLISVTGGGGGGASAAGQRIGRNTADGSGGGGGTDGSPLTGGIAGTYGSAGGDGVTGHPNYAAAGGGGAGGAGGNGSGSTGGAGGAGSASTIRDGSTSVTYAGGGGGQGYYYHASSPGGTGGAGGSGGGGAGGSFLDASPRPTAGTANTGGGGGAGDGIAGNAGRAGGSGIVIIRYAV